jgi:predicted RNA-binding protein with RPS1 domain
MSDFGNGPEPQESRDSGSAGIAGTSSAENGNGTSPAQDAATETPTAGTSPQTQTEAPSTSEPTAQPQQEAPAQPEAPATGEQDVQAEQPAEAAREESAPSAPEASNAPEPEAETEPVAEQAPAAEAAPADQTPEAAAEQQTSAGEEPAQATPGEAQQEGEGEHAAEPGTARRTGRAWRPPRMSREEMHEVWNELQAKKESREEVELEVVGHNRGGVVAQYKGVEVFIPMSHWTLDRQASGEPNDIRVGATTKATILEITDFETDARRVTASRRGTLRKGLMGSLEVGQRLSGRVSSVHDFGIFVDLGGIDGLVHASEIGHVRGKHPSELVKVGDQVDVTIKEIDADKDRIYLGMKPVGPSPWEEAETKYPIDSIQTGKVVGFSKNGAFIELEPGIEGFVRMRELSWTKRVQRPRDVLRKGADVQVKVLDISGRKQRLSLSYRQAQEDPWKEIAEKYAVGTQWKGKITELSNKGVVIDLGEVEGFLPRGRMGREAKRLPDMKAGEELEVTVLEVDPGRNSLIFGLGGGEDFRGGERQHGGERGERGGGGERRERSDRGPRGDRRDRGDRMQTAPPAKPVDEIKSAEVVGSFSLGDLLGDAIKKQLGVKEEKPKHQGQQQGQPQQQPAAQQEQQAQSKSAERSEPATEQRAEVEAMAQPQAAPEVPMTTAPQDAVQEASTEASTEASENARAGGEAEGASPEQIAEPTPAPGSEELP